MKKINYYNKELKDDLDYKEAIVEDSYEIKKLTIQVENKDLDYYKNIINTSYGEFGTVTIEEGETPPPTLEEQVASMANMLTILMGV